VREKVEVTKSKIGLELRVTVLILSKGKGKGYPPRRARVSRRPRRMTRLPIFTAAKERLRVSRQLFGVNAFTDVWREFEAVWLGNRISLAVVLPSSRYGTVTRKAQIMDKKEESLVHAFTTLLTTIIGAAIGFVLKTRSDQAPRSKHQAQELTPNNWQLLAARWRRADPSEAWE
jgi:hypothetical protein